ncbi:uncharacterized protein LOC134243961 [Saccostrea cucullata]|uniref:uncharacterized protein LOC134243961 n=1 Tax=Saccostrea cuccullata TaxID=36930 RepID=UPI002ED1E51C
MKVTVILVLCVSMVISKRDRSAVICSNGIKYDLTAGHAGFECASSLMDSLELICGGSAKIPRFKGLASIFRDEPKAMKEFKKDLFCSCCLRQCSVDEIRSFCVRI